MTKAADDSDSDAELEIVGAPEQQPQLAPSDVLRSVFGHDQYRTGQEWAVDRVLEGKSAYASYRRAPASRCATSSPRVW